MTPRPVPAFRLAALCLWLVAAGALGCAPEGADPLAPSSIGTQVSAITVPSGFVDEIVATGITTPTQMEFAPDGRIFVSQQGGSLRVIKNGALLPTPFVRLTVDNSGERGLLGLAFDPAFASNQFIYVYYTTASGGAHNRLSRFTASGDLAVAGSEVVLMDWNPLSGATNHNGGGVHVGQDDKLYIAVGDNANGANAQTLNNRLGKMHRLNLDGSIPTDNPFFNTATGLNRSIWARGLRNPFTFAIQPGTGTMFINDVGEVSFEEINLGTAGANYAWPHGEGPNGNVAGDTAPLFFYNHSSGQCAISGGTFYNPPVVQFPASWVGHYFFADFCAGWIHRLDPATRQSMNFATGLQSPTDLKTGPDGALYYLARANGGMVGRIRNAANQAPRIDVQPTSQTVAVGQPVTFTVIASGTSPLSFQWQRNGASIAGATGSSFTLASATLADDGDQFRAVVSNPFGTATSGAATLSVLDNQGPTATITAPAVGTLYTAGQTISYAGTGADPEDGDLPGSAFTWEVVFHHDTHSHPFLPPTSGARSGSFVIADQGETATNVFYRIHLTVRDAAGFTSHVTTDVRPRTVNLTLQTNPAGLQVTLDGQPVTTPATIGSVVGMQRALGVVSPQSQAGKTYAFASWSDGGAATHPLVTPTTDTTLTATFNEASFGGLTGEYFDNADLTNLSLTRVDPTVNFSFGTGAPAPGIGSDTFSVRWTGKVTAAFTETYTFFTLTDDGVRLFVDGRPLVNAWVILGATERSGTIALVAGQSYDLRMEYFDNTGQATARLSWSSPRTPKQVIPAERLTPAGPSAPPPLPIKINFQLAGAPVPAGYLADTGAVFAFRNGLSYGWNRDHTDVARDRNLTADQRLDTLCHFHAGGVWELSLPNGTYNVLVSVGDASTGSTYTLNVEGTNYWNGVALPTNDFRSMTRSIVVTDGRLTLNQGSAPEKATRINFIEIAP